MGVAGRLGVPGIRVAADQMICNEWRCSLHDGSWPLVSARVALAR